MPREARFACWVAAIAMGITAPLWSALSVGSTTPTLIGVTLNVIAVLGIIALVITTPPDAIRVSPMTNWLLLAAGMVTCHVVGKSSWITMLMIFGILLWMTFPPRIMSQARKNGIPESLLPPVSAAISTRIWSLVAMAWLPIFWAGPDVRVNIFDLSEPLAWTMIGCTGGGLACCWFVTRPHHQRWAALPAGVWAFSAFANAGLRLHSFA